MSEKINSNHEVVTDGNSEHYKHNAERIKQHHEKESQKAEHKSKSEIDKIIKSVEKTAKSSEELKNIHKHEDKQDKKDQNIHIGTQLKSQALKQNLRKIQKNLPAYERPFSKLIHNSKVEAVSDVVGGTIARPNSLLIGGIFSFLSSVFILTICRYYGYEYNYLVGMASFAGGFLLGIILDGFYRVIKRS